MLSILILTKNEEQDLPDCLSSIEWCDDIHIFDSFSTDKTVEIATNFGAKLSQREFDGYASQRNAALNTLDFKYGWIFILDADERIPGHLANSLKLILQNPKISVNGFRMRRRDYFGSSWLKYSQISPFYIRLVRKGKATYHREINEILQVEGIVENIDDYFFHFPFSKGISHWLNKHNIYSTMEANRWIEEHHNTVSFSLAKAIFAKDFNVRRYNQKGIFYKMPFRPIIKLLYMLFIRLSFLDGVAGITYSTLQAIYEYLIVLKTREIIKNRNPKYKTRLLKL